jgi:hypothetical protein
MAMAGSLVPEARTTRGPASAHARRLLVAPLRRGRLDVCAGRIVDRPYRTTNPQPWGR